MPDDLQDAPPLPGGPLPGADQHVGPLPRRRSRTASTRATTTGTSPATPAPAGAGGGHQRHQRRRATRSTPRRDAAHRPVLPVHQAARRRRAGVHPAAALRADVRGDDDNQLLTAFMVGKSDGDDYGQLQVFVMPRGNLPNGPALVQGEIQSDDDVSRAGDAARSGSGSTRHLRQPHRHPDRRRPRVRAAVLRDLRRRPRCPASRT